MVEIEGVPVGLCIEVRNSTAYDIFQDENVNGQDEGIQLTLETLAELRLGHMLLPQHEESAESSSD